MDFKTLCLQFLTAKTKLVPLFSFKSNKSHLTEAPRPLRSKCFIARVSFGLFDINSCPQSLSSSCYLAFIRVKLCKLRGPQNTIGREAEVLWVVGWFGGGVGWRGGVGGFFKRLP